MNHYESNPVKIGKHEWRVIVFTHPCYGRCTEYQFRRTNTDYWHEDKRWPGYNGNDGTYAGCPKTLAQKVYYPNKPAIDAALMGAV